MIVGIDLGTTNSLVAVYTKDGPQLVETPLGGMMTPSVVGLSDDGSILVGEAARQRLIRHPDLTQARFKRHMGSDRKLALGSKTFTPVELSAMVLRQLKSDAERAIGTSVTEAVISVPAYFNTVQRQATKDAAELAGLHVRRLINEPTAAALATGLDSLEGESRFVVLDLGGGTFDVSILEKFDGLMEVRASSGDAFLGGEDFTAAIAQELSRKAGLEFDEAQPEEREKLLSVAERLKRHISDQDGAKTSFELRGTVHDVQLSQIEFETCVAPLVKRLHRPIEKSFYDAGLSATDIDKVVLVGGATRMPLVRSLAARIFRALPERRVDPDHAIALGAAVQAGLAAKDAALDDVVMTDVSPFSLGIASNDERNGYALQDTMAVLIERNTMLPASRASIFATSHYNQTKIDVRIYQGESPVVADNVQLGQFTIQVPPKPANEEKISVRFTYDVSGLLVVDATVLSTGKSHSHVVEQLAHAMSKSEKRARLKQLEALKVSPHEQAQNIATLERIKHLYELLLGDDRNRMMTILARFEAALNTQDPRHIEHERDEITTLLDEIEASYVL